MREKQGAGSIKAYTKEGDYSYTLGAFPTFELLAARPQIVRRVLASSDFTDSEKLKNLCQEYQVPFEVNDRLVAKLSNKENCYAIGVFSKYLSRLEEDRPHIVLVNPKNMGNLGTIIRTAIGLGIGDLGIILPGADIFNPKTVRASMGALFSLSFEHFTSFDQYRRRFPCHDIFPFMTKGATALRPGNLPTTRLYSLVFGNEASGLDQSFAQVGTSFFIPQTSKVDSLNLTTAVGIAIYAFMNSDL